MAILQKHFLLADDDADDLDLLREALLQVQPEARIATVGTGMEVLAYLAHCPKDDLPELIVLDYNMPGMNGAAVIEALAAEEQFRCIPVLVWSTSNAPHHRAECEEKGAKAYFQKPANFQQVITTAERMLSYRNSPAD